MNARHLETSGLPEAIDLVVIEPPPLDGRRARDHRARLATSEGAWPFAASVCGPITILEERRDETGRVVATRVAQRRDRVELVGWTETPMRRPRGDHACRPRVLTQVARGRVAGEPDPGPAPLPEGFVEAEPEQVARTLGERTRTGGSAWLLVHDGDGFVCEEWRFSRARRGEHGALRGRFTRGRRDGDAWVQSEYAYEWTEDTLVLLGPSHVRRRGGPRGPILQELHLGCGRMLQLVGGDDERWIWLHWGGSRGGIRAYHPDDAETWFADRASCEAARDAEDEGALSSGC